MEKLYTNLLRFGKTHTNIKIGGKYPLAAGQYCEKSNTEL